MKKNVLSLSKKIGAQIKLHPGRQPVCLMADLDDSYVMKYWPPEDVLEKYKQKDTDVMLSPELSVYSPTIRLKRFLDTHNIPLLIVSGRDIYQMNALIYAFEKTLPQNTEVVNFDGIIGGVGTEIYLKIETGEYKIDKEYDLLLNNTPFKRETIYALLQKIILFVRNEFRPVSFDFSKRDRVENADEHPVQRYKISIEFKSDEVTSAKITRFIRKTLDDEGFASIKVLLSCPYALNRDVNKYNLDIVPFSKDKPLLYLKEKFKISTVVAGDSGNDIDMFLNAADVGIVVGNAKRELYEALKKIPSEQKSHLFIAQKQMQGPDAILHFFKQQFGNEL